MGVQRKILAENYVRFQQSSERAEEYTIQENIDLFSASVAEEPSFGRQMNSKLCTLLNIKKKTTSSKIPTLITKTSTSDYGSLEEVMFLNVCGGISEQIVGNSTGTAGVYLKVQLQYGGRKIIQLLESILN